MKELWTRFLAWFKGLPWLVAAGAMVFMALILAFLVEGDLVWTDWIFGLLAAGILAIVIWKIAKKT